MRLQSQPISQDGCFTNQQINQHDLLINQSAISAICLSTEYIDDIPPNYREIESVRYM